MFSGPIESSARNHQAVIPASKKHKNGNGTSAYESTAPSKSERLNSPNTSKWEPDVRMLLSTSQWLKVHIACVTSNKDGKGVFKYIIIIADSFEFLQPSVILIKMYCHQIFSRNF